MRCSYVVLVLEVCAWAGDEFAVAGFKNSEFAELIESSYRNCVC